MERKYAVVRYDGDGGSNMEQVTDGSLEWCREYIASRIDGTLDANRWEGLPEDGDIEAYHESAEEGCGGYTINHVCPRCKRAVTEPGTGIDGATYHDHCAEAMRLDREVDGE